MKLDHAKIVAVVAAAVVAVIAGKTIINICRRLIPLAL
jgi:hypothetical protein